MNYHFTHGPELTARQAWAGYAALRGLLAFVVLGVAAQAEEAKPTTTADLAKHTENPLARVVNLGLISNINFDKGPYERTQSAALVTATVPYDLPRNWDLFLSAKLPLISQPIGTANRTNGLGDLSLIALAAPPPTSGWTFGFGPSIVLPTATDTTLGQGQWEIGPAVAAVYLRKTWVTGLVAYQNWSIVGANDRAGVSRLTLAPFITVYINKGWYFTSVPSISADWYEEPPRAWTVPLGGGIGHIVRRGKHAFNFTVHGYYNVVRPEGAASCQFRFTTSWVFPK